MSSIKWQTFQQLSYHCPKVGFGLDISDSGITSEQMSSHEELSKKALSEMADLESGAISNSDEGRMVGHYWLRNPKLAPQESLRGEIESTIENISHFASGVLNGKIRTATGSTFKNFLLIGIGGSALGPQLLANAFGSNEPGLCFFSLDNTDPAGIKRELDSIPDISETLFITISKSGGTKETRNAMLLTEEYCRERAVPFSAHAIAITGDGSALMKQAQEQEWMKTFPMWDWVGGRTSILSAVGLLPLALLGHSIHEFLDGAREMDALTRSPKWHENPALMLALAWYELGDGGKGKRDMVVLPYKDSLLYFSRYLQQLVMESLGKELDRDGNTVHQGIAVYGNKGSTDQHAYVQQLRDGIENFFVTFIEVLEDAPNGTPLASFEVEDGIIAGDYLAGFLHGTREALSQNGRKSLTITVARVDCFSLGMLIALFERAVGYYASFVNINAYHQPGVEAGKKAAASVLLLQRKIVDTLKEGGEPQSIEELEEKLQTSNLPMLFRILRRLKQNGVVATQGSTEDIFKETYRLV